MCMSHKMCVCVAVAAAHRMQCLADCFGSIHAERLLTECSTAVGNALMRGLVASAVRVHKQLLSLLLAVVGELCLSILSSKCSLAVLLLDLQ